MAQPWAKAFYKSKAWQSIRRQALKRDGYTCARCGATATEVHHRVELTPQNIGNPMVSLNLNNLESLCHDCHAMITAQEHGFVAVDCKKGFYFDENGQLSPRG